MGAVPAPPIVYVPALIGLMIGLFLFGTACMQAITYFTTYPEDRRYLKGIVLVCMFLDLVTVLICFRGVFLLLVHGKLPEYRVTIVGVPKDLIVVSILTSVVTTIVELFYARRVWLLSNCNRAVTGVIAFLSIVQLVSGLIFSSQFLIRPGYEQFQLPKKQVYGIIELMSASACDVTITASLVYFLNHFRSGIKSTDNVITKLVIYSINIGLITTIIVICNLVTWLALPGNPIFTTFHLMLSKVYINTLLVTLNSRQGTRLDLAGPATVTTLRRTGDRRSIVSQQDATALETRETFSQTPTEDDDHEFTSTGMYSSNTMISESEFRL